MVDWEKNNRSGVLGCIGLCPTLFCMQAGAISSDTLAHIEYPVAVGVMGWLVGDDSNKSAVNEHRTIEKCGS